MRSMLNARDKTIKEQKIKEAQAPKAGDMAPDFTLTSPDNTETITLSQFRGEKPVALIFGSYT